MKIVITNPWDFGGLASPERYKEVHIYTHSWPNHAKKAPMFQNFLDMFTNVEKLTIRGIAVYNALALPNPDGIKFADVGFKGGVYGYVLYTSAEPYKSLKTLITRGGTGFKPCETRGGAFGLPALKHASAIRSNASEIKLPVRLVNNVKTIDLSKSPKTTDIEIYGENYLSWDDTKKIKRARGASIRKRQIAISI